MEKKDMKLFKKEESKYVDAMGTTHHFTYLIYEGMQVRPAKYFHIEREVEVKALYLFVNEVIFKEGEIEKGHTREYDFGFLSSRSNEINTVVRDLMSARGIQEFFDIVKEARDEFRVHLDKDAHRALKKLLGMRRIEDRVNNKMTQHQRKRQPLNIPKYKGPKK